MGSETPGTPADNYAAASELVALMHQAVEVMKEVGAGIPLMSEFCGEYIVVHVIDWLLA